jgi:hypothetical protein
MLSGLNATVLASWVPVIQRTPPESLALVVPALNNLEASTLEALVAALPYLNMDTVLALLPLINALPASTLAAYLKLLGDVSGIQHVTAAAHTQWVLTTWQWGGDQQLHPLMHAKQLISQ